MGTVYEAHDLQEGIPVALKTLPLETVLDIRARTRLLREAYALSEVHHPAAVRYIDHGVDATRGPFLVMEWIVGETLEERLATRGLSPVESLGLVERLASGLDAVHARGVVHRDLKPSNILLASGDVGQAVLVDFGVARVAVTGGLTVTGDYVGTPRYMPPEQIRNARTVDPQADVFALGCILCECLTGGPAFPGTDPVTIIARILFEPAPVPSAIRPGLPAALDEVVAAMLDRDPARRPTMAETRSRASDLQRQLARVPAVLVAVRAGHTLRRSDRVERPDVPPAWATSEDDLPASFEVDPRTTRDEARRVLPPMHGAFVGRDEERAQLRELLRTGASIAVWGGPGVGKTRLVVEAVREAVEARDPAWDAIVYADLAEARDTDDVLRALAVAARVSIEASGTPELSLAGALGKLGRVLLVVDPVDRVAAVVGTLAHAFRRAAPRLQLVAISRRRRRPPEATEVEVTALPTVAAPGAALSPAAQLVLARMAPSSASRAAKPEVADRAERLAVALEGNPLAIELAVPSAQILGVDGLLARLAVHADGASGGVEPVRVGMRAALESSYDALTEAERAAFAQCAVFRGAFAFDGAESVIRVKDAQVLDLVQSLREHSLLSEQQLGPDGGPDGEVRLAMPAAVRDLAWQKLRGVFEPEPVLRRHAAYYAKLHQRKASGVSNEGLSRIERDADNLFAAAEFCFASDDRAETDGAAGFGALVDLEPAVVRRGAVSGYLRLVDDAIAWADARDDAAAATLGASVRCIRARFDGPAGRAARAKADLARCLEDARRHGERYREGLYLLDLGVVHHLEHDWAEARRLYDAAVERLESVDDPWAFGRCLGNLGALSHDDGDLAAAARMYRQAIELLEQAGETRQRANFMGNLALIEQESGDPARARGLFEQALVLLEPIRDARLLAICLGNLGVLELEHGDPARAVTLYERALGLLTGSGDARSRALGLARLAAALAILDRSALARARFAQAEALAAGAGELVVEVVGLTRAFLDLAAAREARGRGQVEEAAASEAAAKARVERAEAAHHGGRSLRERSDDVRSTLRILARMTAGGRRL
jgi:tetratricopeptide (TPR) repeat protein